MEEKLTVRVASDAPPILVEFENPEPATLEFVTPVAVITFVQEEQK